MTKTNIELTQQEKTLLENLDRLEKPRGHFGQIKAKSYLGNVSKYHYLNLLKKQYALKYVGTLQFLTDNGKEFWYLNAIDGETYRIPEPENGIDEMFDTEFKRWDI